MALAMPFLTRMFLYFFKLNYAICLHLKRHISRILFLSIVYRIYVYVCVALIVYKGCILSNKRNAKMYYSQIY